MPVPIIVDDGSATLRSQVMVDAGHDVFETRLGDPQYPMYQNVPRCAYIYTLTMNGGKPSIEHRFHPGKNDMVEIKTPVLPLPRKPELAAALEQALKDNIVQSPQGNFRTLVWRHISYVCCILDVEGWDFDDAVITFSREGESPNHSTYNRSFFDGYPLELTMPSGVKRPALVFINHMIGQDGNHLPAPPIPAPPVPGPDSDKFKFSLYFRIKFQGLGSAIWIFDPSGTNQGPPLDPPGP